MIPAFTPVLFMPKGVAGFQGVGDVVSGARDYWGLRAYSAAVAATTPIVINLRRDSDNATQDFNLLANGDLDVASIATFKGAANLFVTRLNGQINSGHLTQATAANQPGFLLSGLGSKPVITFNPASNQFLTGAIGTTLVEPYTYNFVAKQTNVGAQNCILSDTVAFAFGYELASAANNIFILGGTTLSATCSSGAWHAVSGVWNTTSSAVAVDAAQTTGTSGTSLNITGLQVGNFASGTQSFNGNLTEIGLWPIAFNATQLTNMSANQHAYWGF
jgi:hypothetical protein